MVGILSCQQGSASLIPGLGTKIPHEAKNQNKVVEKKKTDEGDVCIGTHPYVFRMKRWPDIKYSNTLVRKSYFWKFSRKKNPTEG